MVLQACLFRWAYRALYTVIFLEGVFIIVEATKMLAAFPLPLPQNPSSVSSPSWRPFLMESRTKENESGGSEVLHHHHWDQNSFFACYFESDLRCLVLCVSIFASVLTHCPSHIPWLSLNLLVIFPFFCSLFMNGWFVDINLTSLLPIPADTQTCPPENESHQWTSGGDDGMDGAVYTTAQPCRGWRARE